MKTPALRPDCAAWHICVMAAHVRSCLLALALSAGACTQFPTLEGTVPPALETAPYPELVPLEPLIARQQDSTETATQAQSDVAARAAALRARAARLRGTVVDSGTRTRMQQGVSEG